MLPDVELLDLAGPLQAFYEANGPAQRYEIRTVSTRPEVRSAQGVTLSKLGSLDEVDDRTIVVVPGLIYRNTEHVDTKVIRWLRKAYAAGATVASVCTGSFILGEAGLLDERRCTTHWSRVEDLQRRFRRATVLTDRLFVRDGRVVTSAGIASGIDMALALIEAQHGPLVASEVAREMVVYIRRDGAHRQTSIYLDFRTHMNPGIHRVQDFLIQNPQSKASLDRLAEISGMSERNLTRLFRQATGVSIKGYTTRIRVELARSLAHDPGLSMDAIARRCGFTGSRQLRRLLSGAQSRSQ